MQIFVQKTPPQTPNVIKPRLIYYNDALCGVGRKLISLIARWLERIKTRSACRLHAREIYGAHLWQAVSASATHSAGHPSAACTLIMIL
jgi:hypothetical protein